MHSGGVPDGVSMEHKFIRLYFYLPTKSQKPPPIGDSIYRVSSCGMYYFIDHWHTDQNRFVGEVTSITA